MPIDKPSDAAKAGESFFRQSGWLMMANIGGGVLMWAVHFLSKPLGPAQYGIFGVLLAVAICVPTIPLQMAVAHQTALALARDRRKELARMIRVVWLVTFLIWLVAALIVLGFQDRIVHRWELTNPAALWITLGVVLCSIWMPIFWGVLQGAQSFLWLGWSMISSGIGRLSVAVVLVLVFAGAAASMMTGVLAGMVIATLLAAWHSRSLWTGASAPFHWADLLKEVIPPLFGFAAFQFLFTADTMFVKGYFDSDSAGFYVSAGTLARALMWLVGPLATVMFPRIVHSAARAEKSSLMSMVLLGTAVLAILGAIGLAIVGPWVVRFVSGEKFVRVASSLLPWYAAAMVPLALANVLLNNLLARSLFKVVVPICLLAIFYGFALTRFHSTLIAVLQVMTVFNSVLLGICAAFTRLDRTSALSTAP